MMLRKFIVFIAFFGYVGVKGQDITTGLFETNPLSFNPAYAIPGYNEWVFMANSRQQWWKTKSILMRLK